jgi:hypothetical protein
MLRFQTQLQVSSLPDELIDNQFEVIMPKLNIQDFDQNIASACKSKGFLSEVINSALGQSYMPIVEQINFEPQKLKTTARRVRTGWYNLPQDLENYGTVTMTFFCSNGMLTQYYLEAWRNMIFNKEGEFFYPSYVYKKNIEVYIYGPGNVALEENSAVARFTLKGCFPIAQEQFKFRYSNNPKRVTITATFQVDKIVYDETLANSSIIQELLTSPTTLLDKAVTSLMGEGTPYSIQDTYK